jgi:hypothetical protein
LIYNNKLIIIDNPTKLISSGKLELVELSFLARTSEELLL